MTIGEAARADRAEAPAGAALQPTRDRHATLSHLVDVLLDKGVRLDLDLVITVADIPLIGVNLQATIAGIETMLEYGLMSDWDEAIRAGLKEREPKELEVEGDARGR